MNVAEKKRAVSVTKFAIEARTPRNQDLMIQSLGKMRLRGAVSAMVETLDKTREEGDEDEIPVRRMGAKLIEGVGELPGMCLYVDPAVCSWKIADPLYKDEKTMDQVAKAMQRTRGAIVVDRKLRGMKPKSGRLGRDEMKTLCKELLCFIEAGDAKVVHGIAPTSEDIDELPGDYLLNWTNTEKWRQPRYAKDYEKWANRVSQLEGDT